MKKEDQAALPGTASWAKPPALNYRQFPSLGEDIAASNAVPEIETNVDDVVMGSLALDPADQEFIQDTREWTLESAGYNLLVVYNSAFDPFGSSSLAEGSSSIAKTNSHERSRYDRLFDSDCNFVID